MAQGAKDPRIERLKVHGASIYHEILGSGPILLMIPGGPVDAGVFTDLARRLADEYTVVTYDPRGHSRSTLEGPPEDILVAVHADDAHELIASFTTEPAYVYGSSGGATIGLDLVARHPDRVRTLVAHEPPLMALLSDREHWPQRFDEIQAAYRTGGAFAGMQAFGDAVQEGGPAYEPPTDPSPEEMEFMQRMMGNFDLFLAHELVPIGLQTPDVDALRSASTRIVVAGGDNSGEQAARRASTELAARLGTEVTVFPGGHGGSGSDPAEFAARLRSVLRES